MNHLKRGIFRLSSAIPIAMALTVSFLAIAFGQDAKPKSSDPNDQCVSCHSKLDKAIVMEWQRSRHAQSGIGCLECHAAETTDIDGWNHNGVLVAALVTPKDCAKCHDQEYQQFARSHHAKAGQILASLDNVLAERAAGMPGNNADAVSGCWQCHGTVVKFVRDKDGKLVKKASGVPLIDAATWPNSGMGRMNPDGSQGSCHACHSRHSFEAKLARSPENCGKCHMGPDHPQIEIYNESKHGIAFHANRDRMALDKDGDWVLGKDYSAAPTCATCHISSHSTPNGVSAGNTHDVGERISWTLRPAISKKQNLVVFQDGEKEDYPEDRPLPKVGDVVKTIDKVVEGEKLMNKNVDRKVERIIKWEERRDGMKGVCKNCHGDMHTDNFYAQYDNLVGLFNDKFGKPAAKLIADLTADSVLKANAPFEHELQWTYYELWHHEGRRARHGAAMMGPDYTHWHGLYEVSKHYYTKFLPQVIEAAAEKSPAMGKKYEGIVNQILTQDEHIWKKGLSPKEAEELRKAYKARYN
jgi:hydroxylamine dehydrogenase